MKHDYEDLTGQVFGRLTVEGLAPKPPGSRKHGRHWLCRCSCGGEKITTKDQLECGKAKSCGCIRREKMEAGNLVGQVFSRLTVIEPRIVECPSKTQKRWLCRCECGKERVVSRTDLLTGHVKSCGCLQKDTMGARTQAKYDMTGQRHGMLLVLGRAPAPEGRATQREKSGWYLCKCDCGKEVVRSSAYLRQVQMPCCGCRTKEYTEHTRRIGEGSHHTENADRKLRAKRKEKPQDVARDKNDRICTWCGEHFDCYAGEEWAYKRINRRGKKLVFCSYGCVRKWDAAKESAKTFI